MSENASFPSTSAAPPEPTRPRRRWLPWVLSIAGLVLAVVLAIVFFLDPWLRHMLEKQVSKQTHGQYQLRVNELHTSLWNRSIRLAGIRLRPAAEVADTLPRLRFDLARLRITGVGLWKLLRKQVVPIDSIVLDSAHLNVLALARRPTRQAGQPLHERLPLNMKGVDVGYFALRRMAARYEPTDRAQPAGRFARADVVARQLLISPAGAADTQRLAYAATWQLAVQQLRARALYHALDLRRLAFATSSQRFEIDSLRIREPQPGEGKPGAVRVNLTVPHTTLTGLQAAAWQHQQHFQADSLLLETPALAFKPPAQRPPDLWRMLQPLARRSDVAQVRVRNGSMQVQGLQHEPSVMAVYISGSGIRIDSAAKQAPARVAYARAWQAHTGRLQAAFDAPYYQAEGAHLRLNTTARTLSLTGLALTPKFSPVQLNLRHGYQVPQFRVRVPELAVAGLDFALLVRHGDVHAARITVRRPELRIASDGRGPINPRQSIVTPEAMRRLSMRLDVRRLDLVDGRLTSRYRSPTSPVLGRIGISRLSGSLYNISNDPRRMTSATPLTGTATAWLQNRCRMSVHLAVPLLDPAGRHRVWGSFGPGEFAMLNEMTVPTRLVEFKQGKVQGITFALRADRQRVTGTMTTRYTGLQLQLLSYKKGEVKQSLGKKIISKAANVLVIRDQNPRKSGRVVTGDMTSQREPRFSVFVLWRQGIVSGLLNNVGLPQPLAQKISQSKDVAPLPTGSK